MGKITLLAISLFLLAGLFGCSCMTGSLPLPDEDGEENVPESPDAPDMPGEADQHDLRPDQDVTENLPDPPVDSPDTPETADVTPDNEDLPDGCTPGIWLEYPSTTAPVEITDMGLTTDSVMVDDCPYTVRDIKVALDVECYCMYCLNISLESPRGVRFPLYRTLFDTSEYLRGVIPENIASRVNLCTLTGGPNNGEWTLRIENDSYQLGTINSWSLLLKGDYEYCRQDAYYTSDAFPMAIPDNSPSGVTSSVEVPGSLTISNVEVYVSILHSYIGDILITLIPPVGSPLVLYNQTGDGDDAINVTFPTDMAPVDSLATLNGQNAQGTWELRVADMGSITTGEFLGWILHVR